MFLGDGNIKLPKWWKYIKSWYKIINVFFYKINFISLNDFYYIYIYIYIYMEENNG